MTNKIIEINEKKIKDHSGEFAKNTVEETFNAILDERSDGHAESYSCQEDRNAALDKSKAVCEKLKKIKFSKATEFLEESIDEVFTYYNFPGEHWQKIRTNNPLERLLREVRRRTKVVGSFPDGESALMLVAARLWHVATTRWERIYSRR